MGRIPTLEELKKSELEILNYIEFVCKQHNIQYFLAGGTLIGAVRHKGFIPWDDDIDLFMPRKDYMKFIEVTKNDSENKYRVMSLYTQKNYYYPFIKVVDTQKPIVEDGKKAISDYGIWVDIFPLDFLNEKNKKFAKLKKNNIKLVFASTNKFTPTKPFLKNVTKMILYAVYHKRNPRKYAEKIERTALSSTKETNKYYFAFSPVGKRDIYSTEWFSSTVPLEFEGKMFQAPIGYHEILTKRYGDYMKLPPKEKQVAVHHITMI